MKRLILALPLLLAVSGCERLTAMNSDAFAMGSASQERFQADSQACAAEGERKRSYELAGITAADNAEQQIIFNDAYAACMKAHGYREQTGWFDFWQGYNI